MSDIKGNFTTLKQHDCVVEHTDHNCSKEKDKYTDSHSDSVNKYFSGTVDDAMR